MEFVVKAMNSVVWLVMLEALVVGAVFQDIPRNGMLLCVLASLRGF